MKKVKIDLKINDYAISTFGILNKNILSFNDKDIKKTNIIYNFNTNVLIRDNDEITIKMFFNKEKDNIFYKLKSENATFYNNLTNFSLQNKPGEVIIKYRIEKTDYKLQIFYEEV